MNTGSLTDVVTQDKGAAWHDARLGRFTASRFGELMSDQRGLTEEQVIEYADLLQDVDPTSRGYKALLTKAIKAAGIKLWSGTAMSYIAAVAAERLTGIEAYSAQTKAMEWGLDMEEKAFEFLNEIWLPLEAATFVPMDKFAGATPDAYGKDKDGLFTVDIKCPFNSAVFVQWCAIGNSAAHLLKFNKDYYWQIMGQARVCGMDRCAIVYVDPRMPEDRHKWKARIYKLEDVDRLTIDNTLFNAEIECQRLMELMQD